MVMVGGGERRGAEEEEEKKKEKKKEEKIKIKWNPRKWKWYLARMLVSSKDGVTLERAGCSEEPSPRVA